MKIPSCCLALVALLFGGLSPLNAAERPNLLLVVADDLGFSDLGSFGGEIDTPNLDRLAIQGLRLSNFHTAATCSPTRSMLLTGVDHHRAGLGSMAELLTDNQRGKPGYEGYLNERVISIASRLRDSGYATYMAGKWHLGLEPEQSPAEHGFDRSFVLLQGGGGHYNDIGPVPHTPRARYRDGEKAADLPDDFYSSRFYTDKILRYLEEGADSQKPFFAYLAYTAPHWPLQAPRNVIEKYRGRYDAGYDVLRRRRVASLQTLGLIAKGLQQRLDYVPDYQPWQQLRKQEQLEQSRVMEVYAAMVDEMDRQFGRLLDYLDKTGELDNTVIIFLSDNGAEGFEFSKVGGMSEWLAEHFDNSLDNLGNANSFIYQGSGWATAVMAPFYNVKRTVAQGGIHTPAFVWYPGFKRRGDVSDAFITVKDIAPTVLSLAGVDFSGDRYRGRPIEPITGRSFMALLEAKASDIYGMDEALAWELFGHRAVRRGPWKLLSLQPPYGDGSWRLYNLDRDPAETDDLSGSEADIAAELLNDWKAYADANGVILPQ